MLRNVRSQPSDLVASGLASRGAGLSSVAVLRGVCGILLSSLLFAAPLDPPSSKENVPYARVQQD